MNKIRIAILRNETDWDHLPWIKACEARPDQVDYRVVDLTKNNWLEEIQSAPFDILLAKPGGLTAVYKQLYDERAYILERVLGYKLFPCADEIFIYENKRFFSTWLKAHKIPHPATRVFYNMNEASEYIQKTDYPLIAKVNIGASGSGVFVLHDQNEATNYINQTFKGKGAPQRSGPNLSKGDLLKRGMRYIFNPSDIRRKLDIYRTKRNNLQTGFVIFQEYIPHDFEWRVVRIGDSFFAHKKLKIGEKSSGSLLKSYEDPPLDLFDFVKNITDKHHMYSQAVDIFEDQKNGYLVNEMQCMFGQSDPYQMLVDGKPGRYRYINGKWHFEAGDFAGNACFDLRLEHAINLLERKTIQY